MPQGDALADIQSRTDISEHERNYLAAGWVIEWQVTAGSHAWHREHWFAIVDAVKSMRVLLEQNARLRAALEFYADRMSWGSQVGLGYSKISADGGECARAALGGEA
jgi:hypothetical protein